MTLVFLRALEDAAVSENGDLEAAAAVADLEADFEADLEADLEAAATGEVMPL